MSIAFKKCKKNAVLFKLFWYKVFVHWKLKLLNFLMDSILILILRLSERTRPLPRLAGLALAWTFLMAKI